jgi:hypothetical protein
MTLATGKGGRYRYYKCNTRISKGIKLCDSPSHPMEKLDSLILTALANKVFDPDRVKIMLSDMKKQIKAAQESQDDGLKKLTKELGEIKTATDRLYEAVEKGFLPLDSSLQERSHKLQARRQELLILSAGYRRQQKLPDIKQNQLTAFTKALRTKLLDRKSGFGKEYLKLLVSEIRIKGNQAEITGSYSALAHAIDESKIGSLDKVPSFVPNWLGNASPGAEERVAPALLFQSHQPTQVGGYVFIFRLEREAKLKAVVYPAAGSQPVFTQDLGDQPGGQPVEVRWNTTQVPQGAYRIVLNGYARDNNDPLTQIVHFYHQPVIR